MVLSVRCYKCGAEDARLVLGGREILQARCETCGSNLLAEVLDLQAEIESRQEDTPRERQITPRQRQITPKANSLTLQAIPREETE